MSDELSRLSAALAPQWRVERALGASAWGPAYLVSGASIDRVRGDLPGVLRILGPALRQEVRDAEAFLAALERAERVRHEAFPALLGDGMTADETIYFVTESSDGGTAADRIAGGEPFGAAEVGALGAELADGLEDAHRIGVHHGGIAPSQIVLGDRGAQLMGLGVYEALMAGGGDAYRIASLTGVRQYASPEQLAGAPLDARSDVYSLGATLFELLTGKPPFGGRTTAMVMASVLGDEPSPSGARGVQSTGPVVDAVLRAIERTPDDRWPSAAAFAAALRRPPGRPRVRDQDSPQRRKARAGCAGVALLGAGGFALAGALAVIVAASR